jgi:beta-glucosidase
MNHCKIKFVILLLISSTALFAKAKPATPSPKIYLDPSKSVNERVTNLLGLMTLEEKVAQMCQYVSPLHIIESETKLKGKIADNNDANAFYPTVNVDSIYRLVEKGLIGSFLHAITPEDCNTLQKLAMKSRLKIPLIIGVDAIHGAGLSYGTTIYPSAITQASSFNLDLVEKSGQETALETRAFGSSWVFTPNIDVCRDPRWGRIGETFGEDPYLVSRMGIATIKGLEGKALGAKSVAACAKHLVGGGQPSNGLNASPMEVSPYNLADIYLYPFKKVIEETNVQTIMVAHNEVNGVPCHADKQLMTNIIRDQYKFKGFYVSDWNDISRIYSLHHYAPTLNDAFYESVNAGMDMNMHGPYFFEAIVKSFNDKRLPIERVNAACAKILETKFRLGLFENPFTDIVTAKKDVFTAEHQNTALKMAEQSLVLLKNEGLLPLDFSKYKNILVTGPNANSQAILGDWVFKQPDEQVTTILEGIQQVAGKENVKFCNVGTDVRFTDMKLVNNAVSLAKISDLAIVVVGENPMRYEEKIASSGENIDRQNLDLLGLQQQLVEKIHATGVPTIVVLVGGRPLALNWIDSNIPAILQAWEPGSLGGLAVANVLSGKVNPSGKLPVTIPRTTGQIPMIYNHKPSYFFKNYKDGETTPLYPFGYGLSYTNFVVENVAIPKKEFSINDTFEVTADVQNIGKREGTEIVQLYIHDVYSQPTRPVKELKDFSRVSLLPGEKKRVTFTITPEKLSYTNMQMQWGVEAGEFEIMVGTSSEKKDLKTIIVTVK